MGVKGVSKAIQKMFTKRYVYTCMCTHIRIEPCAKVGATFILQDSRPQSHGFRNYPLYTP